MCFRRATTIAAVAAALLASAPAATARTAAGYRTCSVLHTIAWHSWVVGSDGRYHPVTFRKPYAFSVVFPVAGR